LSAHPAVAQENYQLLFAVDGGDVNPVFHVDPYLLFCRGVGDALNRDPVTRTARAGVSISVERLKCGWRTETDAGSVKQANFAWWIPIEGPINAG